jgi:hypothetical protein
VTTDRQQIAAISPSFLHSGTKLEILTVLFLWFIIEYSIYQLIKNYDIDAKERMNYDKKISLDTLEKEVLLRFLIYNFSE